jgi:hypothetical protein
MHDKRGVAKETYAQDGGWDRIRHQKEIDVLSSKELVLKTVDHFERNPQSYLYTCNRIPQSLCAQGCVLGWMAYFSGGHQDGMLTPDVIARITCDPISACAIGDNDFFKRLDECYPAHRGHWRLDVTHAIAALRAYVEKYPEAPALPVWARMRDREAFTARQRYEQFRASLYLSPLPEQAMAALFPAWCSAVDRQPSGASSPIAHRPGEVRRSDDLESIGC